MDEAQALAGSDCGAVRAAAGCGKTELIAKAVGLRGPARQLVLTHTHAGVDALRKRMRKLKVPSGTYHIETIAGWALRYCLAFPATSGVTTQMPATTVEWNRVYQEAARLLALDAIRKVVSLTYPGGVYVDEYQDCSIHQHSLVLALAAFSPCRVLGDPLQGIFGFGDNEPIKWPEHVEPVFPALPAPTQPHRWLGRNDRLGAWLGDVRRVLDGGGSVDLRQLPAGVADWRPLSDDPAERRTAQWKACTDAAGHASETAVAILQVDRQRHKLASSLKGRFSCVERMEFEDLLTWADRIEGAKGYARAVELIDFVCSFTTGLKTPLAKIRAELASGKVPPVRTLKAQLAALLKVADADDFFPIGRALDALAQVGDVHCHRKELPFEMRRAVAEFGTGEYETLRAAAVQARNRTRLIGRPVCRCSFGSTHLVKGLEFHHAVILNADELDRENPYVALTRGCLSLAILSQSPTLPV